MVQKPKLISLYCRLQEKKDILIIRKNSLRTQYMVLRLCPLGLFQPFSRILISKCPWPWLHKWFPSLQGGIKSYEEGTWLLLTDIKVFSVDVRQHSLYELDSHPFILLIFAYFILPHSFQHLIPGTQPHTPQGYDSLISLLFKTEAITIY